MIGVEKTKNAKEMRGKKGIGLFYRTRRRGGEMGHPGANFDPRGKRAEIKCSGFKKNKESTGLRGGSEKKWVERRRKGKRKK